MATMLLLYDVLLARFRILDFTQQAPRVRFVILYYDPQPFLACEPEDVLELDITVVIDVQLLNNMGNHILLWSVPDH